jgi:hypothetical protein
MSLHITRFLDKVRAAESRQQRDVSMTVTEARDLHADITKLLLVLEELRSAPQTTPAEVVTVTMDGGTF